MVITVVGVVWAWFIYDDGGGYLDGIGNVIKLVPVLALSTVVWIIGSIIILVFSGIMRIIKTIEAHNKPTRSS